MRFESRVFTLAKDPEHPEQNQDACCLHAARGIAAIADGVASGIFSRQWAGLLAEAVVDGSPDPQDAASFAQWLAERRQQWNAGIDVSRLAWHQKPKLREGAFSTLLWVQLTAAEGNRPGPQEVWRLRATAVGDSCLLHLRDGQTLRTFPIEQADQLEASPVVLGSVDLGRDHQVAFETFEDRCRPGDLLVLCTDAIAGWALALHQSGQMPDWDSYWDMPRSQWQEEVSQLRQQGRMRYDDATLMLLRVTDGTAGVSQTPGSPHQAGRAGSPSGPPSLQTPGETGDDSPVAVEPNSRQPARLPASPGVAELADKIKSMSEHVAGQVSEQVTRGWKKLKAITRSAESALRKSPRKPPNQHGDS